MKIAKIEAAQLDSPLITPFKTAERTAYVISNMVVRITSDTGETGFGEAPPTAVITGDTRESIRCAVEEFIAPSLTGMDIQDIDGISRRLRTVIVRNSSARAAVDMAVYDLWARSLNVPLYQLLGGHSDSIETDITISLNPVDEMVSDTLKAISRGFHCLKIKVGKGGIEDVDRICAIRQAAGPEIKLRVDANQGWDAKTALRIIRQLEEKDLDIDLIEQPVPATDFEGMKQCTAHSTIPILADESVFTPRDCIRVLEERAADIINIKLMKTGGIYEALKIIGIAQSYGVECMIGQMLEGKIATAAAAHFGAANSTCTRADLDGPALCSKDLYEGGPSFEGPVIKLNRTPGLGITGVPCFSPI